MWILEPKVRETYPVGEPVVGREVRGWEEGWLQRLTVKGGHIVSVLRSLRARCWDGCNGMASWMQHSWFTDIAGYIFSLMLLWQLKLTDILFCVTKLYSVIITK